MGEKVGILHPGEMGVSLAASAQKGGNTVFWTSQGRSPDTRQRAQRYSLVDVENLESLCRSCDIILSVCPPHVAEQVAGQVRENSFRGLYADLNAISPQRTLRIAGALGEAGIDFVDGGIIGGPAWEAGKTWLYLSGRQTARVAACFSAGPLETEVIGEGVGQASALKMCYAAYTKGTAALLCAVLGAAEGLGVRQELLRQWQRDGSGLDQQAAEKVRAAATRGWRFAGEMEEIAATFEASGLPGGFHQAAADIYLRLVDFKGRQALPEIEEVLEALAGDKENEQTPNVPPPLCE